MSSPRVVLDTNTVISALLFSKARLAWIRHAWRAGAFVPVVDHDTASELVRVLAYPKFSLTRQDKEALLADFLPYAETVAAYEQPTGLPEIRNPDDRMFLALAQYASVDALVTGDDDILALRGCLGTVAILSPREFFDWMEQSHG